MNTITIRFQNGDTFTGASPQDIVTQLKLDDWTPYENAHSYKKNIVRRVVNFHGVQIRYKDDLEFLQELNRIGFIESLEMAKEEA